MTCACFAIVEMADFHEQRINIKFCSKLGKTFTQTHETMKQIYGDQCLCHMLWYDGFTWSKSGWESTDDDPCSGRPLTSTDDAHMAQGNCALKSSVDCARNRRRVQHFIGIVSWGPDQKTTNALHCWKAHPTAAESASERQSHPDLSGAFGSRKQGRNVHEENHHWWWDMGLWLRWKPSLHSG